MKIETAIWEALKRRCAATKPTDKNWASVRKLVLVRKEDVTDAVKEATRDLSKVR